MASLGNLINDLVLDSLWQEPANEGRWIRLLRRALRMAFGVARDLFSGELTLRAMGLVYTTLLAIVPLLALSFSVLKGFGVHNQVEPLLENLLAPLGPKGEEITANIITFVDNVRVGVLGSIGLALLLYTSISLIQKIESSFNHIWRCRRSKSLARAFSDYVSVILVGPLLVFTALGITASFMSSSVVQAVMMIEPFGSVAIGVSKLLPYLLVCAAFTFVYLFVPNARVNFGSALVGGVVAGVLWQFVGWAFASFIVGSVRYEAIYSGFAILIMFLIWLYVSWLILLTGSQVAFYSQYPRRLTRYAEPARLGNRERELAALSIMYRVAERYVRGEQAVSRDDLVEELGLYPEAVDDLLQVLLTAGLLQETSSEPVTYVPGRDLSGISVHHVFEVARGQAGGNGDRVRLVPAVNRLMEHYEKHLELSFKDQSLRDLVTDSS